MTSVLFVALCIIISFDSVQSEEHICVHDTLPRFPAVISPQAIAFDQIKRSQGGSRFSQPLRIKFNWDNLYNDSQTCYQTGQQVTLTSGGARIKYTCTAGDVLTPQKEEYLKRIIQAGAAVWTDSLAVMPNRFLDASRGCPMYSVAGIRRPPLSYASIKDADFVLHVTARPIPGGSTLAYAVTCLIDQINRPIAGYANFNTIKLKDNDALYYYQQLSIVAHELAHALGFSAAQLSNWVSWKDDSSSNFAHMPYSTVVQQYNDQKYIMTPNVISVAQKHFNCTSRYVGMLESGGGPGTAMSHWGMKQFYNDIMVGVVSTFPLYTDITYAFFVDAGWYGVYDQSKVQSLVWGRHRGCDFINDCSTWPQNSNDDPGYRCATTTKLGPQDCTFDLRAQGTCSDKKTTVNPLLDSCRYVYAPEEDRCDNPNNKYLLTGKVGALPGEITSRCFRSNLLKLSRNFNVPSIPGLLVADCYNTSCRGPTRLHVSIDGIWYECPYEGGEIKPLDYGGALNCIAKAADRVCLDAHEDEDWPEITDIVPRPVASGAVVHILGKNFERTDSMTVNFVRGDKVPCTNVHVLNDSAINCTVGDSSAFSTMTDILKSIVGAIPVSVVVIDAQGRTYLSREGAQVSIDTTDAIAGFVTKYPGWVTVFILLLIFIFIGIPVIIVVKRTGWNPLKDLKYKLWDSNTGVQRE